jgi:hypothetical protein
VTWRTAGIGATAIALSILLGSLVLGLRGGAPEEWGEVVAPPADPPLAGRVRVEVLNAAGIAGLAREVTEQLRSDGFDVVFYGNAGRLARDSTTVLVRSADRAPAELVAAALGIARLEVAIDTTLYLEATVILSPDWPEIAVRAPRSSPTGPH